MKRIYISGPMLRYRYYNFPMFDAAAEHLHRLGFEPVSPADMDRELGFDPMKLPEDHDWNQLPRGWNIRDVAKRCCEAVLSCDGIYLLPGMEYSKGAKSELQLAKWIGLPHSSGSLDVYILQDFGVMSR